MKICVSGVHGIGKTTLCDWIGKTYDLPVIGERARNLLDSTYPFSTIDKSLAGFMDFQNHVLEGQLYDFQVVKEKFVADRSPVDSLAYVIERLGADRYAFSYYLTRYAQRTHAAMVGADLDIVFFLDFNIEWQEFWKDDEDPQRNLSPNYMQSLTDIMRIQYKRLYEDDSKLIKKLPVFRIINTSDYRERQEIVKETIDEYQRNKG
jgi:adenylate kinase family enzyme